MPQATAKDGARHGRPDRAAMQHDIAVQRQIGFLAGPLDIAKYADLTIVSAADKRLAGGAGRN